jgi:hypothetical protein
VPSTVTPRWAHFDEKTQEHPVGSAAACFLRKPRGLDVYAACGQLKRMELVSLPSGWPKSSAVKSSA